MTQDNILTLLELMQKQLRLSKPLYVAFIDFKRAFNFVTKSILFYKLISGIFNGRICVVKLKPK